jgi:hypothetical protein
MALLTGVAWLLHVLSSWAESPPRGMGLGGSVPSESLGCDLEPEESPERAPGRSGESPARLRQHRRLPLAAWFWRTRCSRKLMQGARPVGVSGIEVIPSTVVKHPWCGVPLPRAPRVLVWLRRWLRKRLVVLATAVAVALVGVAAYAFLTVSATASSAGESLAATVAAGATPSASTTANGREVTISWGASTLSNGHAVDGYLVKRYPSGGGFADINPFSTCAGTVAALSCTEAAVPPGTW